MSYTFTAKVIDESRRALWLEYLGTDTMPIVSPYATIANVPGHMNANVYLVDFESLDDKMQEQLVKMLAAKFGWREVDVWEELDAWPRVPILADGVIVDVRGGEGQDQHER